MTGLEKWKQEAIEEIEQMSVDDVIEFILEHGQGCDYCDIKHSYVNVKGFCEEDCEEGIKAYLESEEE